MGGEEREIKEGRQNSDTIRSKYCLLRSLPVRRQRRNMSNKFTCPLFKLSWVLDAAGSSTLSTYKSARIPPRVVHRSSLSSDTSHTHVLSLKPLADNSERGGAHSYTSSLSLARDNIHCAHRRRDTSSPPGTTIIVPRSATAIAFAVALTHAWSARARTCKQHSRHTQ